MDYATAVEQAPPGWRHFTPADARRLPEAVLRRELGRVPRAELELVHRRDQAATERLTRALFWTLVYHLEAERWDALARSEPIHPRLIAALPQAVPVALDVGAGSGRLTEHLVARSGQVIAIEPSLALGSILGRRVRGVCVVSAWAEQLPLASRSVHLTAACGVFGPDPDVLAELERVTAPGGCIALINPEAPDQFEARGWTRISVDPLPAPAHPSWIDDFFGPPHPPSELVTRQVG